MGSSQDNATNKKLTFDSVPQNSVPHGRKGKHFELVSDILADIGKLKAGAALKVPKAAFGEAKMVNVRAALSRAAEQEGIALATSSDDEFFYVWLDK